MHYLIFASVYLVEMALAYFKGLPASEASASAFGHAFLAALGILAIEMIAYVFQKSQKAH